MKAADDDPGYYESPPSSNWTDPDNAPPDWLHDPNADMSGHPLPAGLRWVFQNGMWQTVQSARDTDTTSNPNTNSAEAAGRAYDAAHGLIGGYMMNGVWVNGSPSSTTGSAARGDGGGGAPGGGFSYDFSGWDPGAPPDFNAPRWQAPPEFAYGKEFTAPNAQELQNDPSFQFRLDQGRKALEQSAAGKGVLRTGGTLKDLVNYGQNFATNEYSNVYNRKFNEYKFDYDKEADIYARNYNLNRDVFDRNYKAAYDEYSPKLKGWETNTNIKARQQEALFNREWQKYLADRGFAQKDLELLNPPNG